MTLGELVDLVCLKTHRDDDDAREEARAYIRSRYEMIWNAHLWRDALCDVTLPPNDVKREMILPGIVDRVVNVLFQDKPLAVENMQIVYRAMAWRLAAQTDPDIFAVLPPSALADEPDGSQLRFTIDTPTGGGSVSVRGMHGNCEWFETIELNGMNYVFTTYEYDVVFALAKSSTEFALHVTDVSERPLLDLEPHETTRKFQRISLISTPKSESSVSILAKRRFKQLVDDCDSTELTGIDNALLAYAIGDVLEAQRQYGKAQAKFTEGSAIVNQMTALEREQSASVVRVVPDGGWEDYDWRSEACHC